MIKAILLSIRPEWVCKILNGKKTIEIRKQFPKDFVGWVYMYVTMGKPYLHKLPNNTYFIDNHKLIGFKIFNKITWEEKENLNGKVVARFWCDKVEEIYHEWFSYRYDSYYTITNDKYGNFNREDTLLKKSCLNFKELSNYLGKPNEEKKVVGYAIHIAQLEIFGRPKELKELRKVLPAKECKNCLRDFDCAFSKMERDLHACSFVSKPPQNYCYIEVGE